MITLTRIPSAVMNITGFITTPLTVRKIIIGIYTYYIATIIHTLSDAFKRYTFSLISVGNIEMLGKGLGMML